MDNMAAIREHLTKAAAALEAPPAPAAAPVAPAAAPAAPQPDMLDRTMAGIQGLGQDLQGYGNQGIDATRQAIQNAQAFFLANRRNAAMGAGGVGALAGAGLGYGLGGNLQSALMGAGLGAGLGGAGAYYGFPFLPGGQAPQQAPVNPEMAAAMKAASANAFLKRALQEGVVPAEQSAEIPAAPQPGMFDQAMTGLQGFGQDLQGYGQQAMQGLQGFGADAMQGLQGLGQDAQQAATSAGNYMNQNPYAAMAAGAGIGGLLGAGAAGLAGGDMGDVGMGGLLGATAGGFGGFYGSPYMGSQETDPALAGMDPATAQAVQEMIDQDAMKQADAINYIRKVAGLPSMEEIIAARGAQPVDPAGLQTAHDAANRELNYANVMRILGPGALGAGLGSGLGAGVGLLAGDADMGAAIGAGIGGLGGAGYGAYTAAKRNQMINEQLMAAMAQQKEMMDMQKNSAGERYIEMLIKRSALGDDAAQDALEQIDPGAAEVADELDEVSDAVAEVAAMDPMVVQAAEIAISSQDPNEAHEAASLVSDAVDTVAAGALTDGMTGQLVDDVAMKAAAGYEYLASLGITKQAIGMAGMKSAIMGFGTGAKTQAGQAIKLVANTFKKLTGQIGQGATRGYEQARGYGIQGGQAAMAGAQRGYGAASDVARKGLYRQPASRAYAGAPAANYTVPRAGTQFAMDHPTALSAGAAGAAGLGAGGYGGYQAGKKEAAADAYINDLVKIAGRGEAVAKAAKTAYEGAKGYAQQGGAAVASGARRAAGAVAGGAQAAGRGIQQGAQAAGRGMQQGAQYVGQHPMAFSAGAAGAAGLGVGGYVYATLEDGTPVAVPAEAIQPIPQQMPQGMPQQ